jgi:hypothetical protein
MRGKRDIRLEARWREIVSGQPLQRSDGVGLPQWPFAYRALNKTAMRLEYLPIKFLLPAFRNICLSRKFQS